MKYLFLIILLLSGYNTYQSFTGGYKKLAGVTSDYSSVRNRTLSELEGKIDSNTLEAIRVDFERVYSGISGDLKKGIWEPAIYGLFTCLTAFYGIHLAQLKERELRNHNQQTK